MSLPDQEDQSFTLTGGRRDGPSGAYIFPFPGGAWPEIGRRGEFHLEAEGWRPARLIDRRGVWIYLSLAAEKPPPSPLSGRIRFFPRPPGPELKLPPDRPAPPGAALFLDPQEGWLWNATEAASQKASLYEAALWPAVARQDLPARLGDGGLSFIWLQAPDPEGATPRLMAEYFLRTGTRLLVVGDSPADLEPLAEMPGALFNGEARADSPLGRITLGLEMDRRRTDRETRLAEGRRAMSELKDAEAAPRARLDLWVDLDDLERRFQGLGQEINRRRREWARVRKVAAEKQSAWAAAARRAHEPWPRGGRLVRFLARFWSRGSPAKTEERRRAELEEAEAAVREVRLAEEAAWSEARNLEERLGRQRREAAAWPPRAKLAEELERLAGKQKATAEALAAESARPPLSPDQLVAEAPLVLALAPDLAEMGRSFPAVLRLASRRPDPQARLNLAALVLNAEKHLVIMGDFTFWPVWSGRAPAGPEAPESPAWRNFKVAEEKNALKEFWAAGGLFRPSPPEVPAPRLARLELGPAGPPAALGLGLRAFGEMGPVNPMSALAVARAALDFAENRPEEPAALILTASPSQGRLINLMLRDLGAPPGLIFAGEPGAFNGWPRAPLVILEPAYETPHQGHPWAWPTFGRWRLQLAWALAGEQIWLAGREAWLSHLPPAAPLAALWRAAGPELAPAHTLNTPPQDAIRRILEQARGEIWAFLPTPGADWWRDWEEPLLAAARRRQAVTILSAPPGPADDPDFAGAALRKLGANNCTVGLASGFPGFLAGVDDRHLIWGAERGKLQSHLLPLAVPGLAEILQSKLIIDNFGRRGGGLKTCRLCGQPLLLINQPQLRGLGDEQPLQVGCLGCPNSGRQRLDEWREPFTTPPKCGLDRFTPYRRIRHGRHQEVWACPRHPGNPACPSYRVVPGDCP